MSITKGVRGHRLARAVPCNWEGCGNTTRDPSMFCQHHQRSTQHGGTQMYRDGSTIIDRLRTVPLKTTLARTNPGWAADISQAGSRLMDGMPNPRFEGRTLTIWNAVKPGATTATWNGRTIPAFNAQGVRDGSNVVRLHGTSLVIAPDSGDLDAPTAQAALQCVDQEWRRRVTEFGAFAGAGEEYDDVAEVLAQFSVSGDPSIEVSYSNPKKMGIALLVTIKESLPDGKAIETFTIIDVLQVRESRLGRYSQAMPPVSRTRISNGRSWQEPVSSDIRLMRGEIIDNVIDTLNLVNRYGVRNEGKTILLPGWSDRTE